MKVITILPVCGFEKLPTSKTKTTGARLLKVPEVFLTVSLSVKDHFAYVTLNKAAALTK